MVGRAKPEFKKENNILSTLLLVLRGVYTMDDNKYDLYEQFLRLEWLLRRYHLQAFKEFGPLADPHRGQGRVLALLKIKPEISQKELANILNIRSQSLGELLSKLERSGYITRTPSEEDRRVIMIRLTDAGKQAANQDETGFDSEDIFDCLNEEEQATLSSYYKRIISELKKHLGDSDFDFPNMDFPWRLPFGRGGLDPRKHGFPPFFRDKKHGDDNKK